ncbi:anthrone oxygenase family protein [Elioraea rosea]|uniref:anthrone oxygenase family protein n=1 Tax=Elioraea rosea TaxID=2492390 RepID=UPI0011844C9F|nr:anthrone oxygenase family protein [Elioraea rosea]
MTPLVLLAAIGAGTMGGFFYAFSGLVMPSLRRLDPPGAMKAMQTINVVVLSPHFFALFFGTAALSLAIIVSGVVWPEGAPTWLAIAGGSVYLAAIIGVTVAANVPMNQALAAADAGAPEGAALWAHYLKRWTAWNHVRAVGGMVSLALFLASLVARA